MAAPEKDVVVCSGGFLRVSKLKTQNKAQARNTAVQMANKRRIRGFFKYY
jgi:hypothetical protein